MAFQSLVILTPQMSTHQLFKTLKSMSFGSRVQMGPMCPLCLGSASVPVAVESQGSQGPDKPWPASSLRALAVFWPPVLKSEWLKPTACPDRNKHYRSHQPLPSANSRPSQNNGIHTLPAASFLLPRPSLHRFPTSLPQHPSPGPPSP